MFGENHRQQWVKTKTPLAGDGIATSELTEVLVTRFIQFLRRVGDTKLNSISETYDKHTMVALFD